MTRTILLAGTCLSALAPLAAAAGPRDGRVVGGSASIQPGQTTIVTQHSQAAIIDWRSFNIQAGETTTFVQPNASSAILNRITGREGPSQIHGMLEANGRVFIVNPDGILFGQGARVNVGSLLATTHDIANQDFMAGRYRFSVPGTPSASVVNEGTITASSGGFAALVAPGVRNSGTISARLGTVALSAGSAATLDFYGDQLINLKVDGDIEGEVIDVGTGQRMQSNVLNAGKLKANGGVVQMTAATARKVVDSVINNTGIIEAKTVRQKGGTIILGAETASTKSSGAPVQVVKVSGTLAANGKHQGSKGGKIRVTGEKVALVGARLTADGPSGGGTILVGGDFRGGRAGVPVNHPKAAMEGQPVPASSETSVDRASFLSASASQAGDGGKVIVWSDGATVMKGMLAATGGTLSGNGGFAEVSGKMTLDFAGMSSSLAAPNGTPGTILYDPQRLIIGVSEAATIAAMLNTTSQVILTADEDIRINASISKTAGGDAWLEFYAGRGIHIGPGVTIGSSSGKLYLWLEADSSRAYNFAQSRSPNLPSNSPSDFFITHLSDAAAANLGNPAADQGLVGKHVRDLIGTVPELEAADVFVDPSARIFLNGGEMRAWGSNYRISKISRFTDPAQVGGDVDLWESLGPEKAECQTGANNCGYAWSANSNPGSSPFTHRFEVLGYQVDRFQTNVSFSTAALPTQPVDPDPPRPVDPPPPPPPSSWNQPSTPTTPQQPSAPAADTRTVQERAAELIARRDAKLGRALTAFEVMGLVWELATGGSLIDRATSVAADEVSMDPTDIRNHEKFTSSTKRDTESLLEGKEVLKYMPSLAKEIQPFGFQN